MTASPTAGAAIPVPRPSPETPPGATPWEGAARTSPGWLTLVEALDGFAAAMVARLEHQLTRAAAEDLARLRRQLAAAHRLEATTSAAVERARQGPAAADHRPEPVCR